MVSGSDKLSLELLAEFIILALKVWERSKLPEKAQIVFGEEADVVNAVLGFRATQFSIGGSI